MVRWCKEGECNAQISPKAELCGFQWANTHNRCVHDYLTGKFVTKPMSYVAALHVYRIKLNPKSQIQVPNQYCPYAYCILDKGVVYTRGRGGYAQVWFRGHRAQGPEEALWGLEGGARRHPRRRGRWGHHHPQGCGREGRRRASDKLRGCLGGALCSAAWVSRRRALTPTPRPSAGVPGAQLSVLEGHTKEAKSVAFSPDGTALVSASEDAMIRIWAIPSGVWRAAVQVRAAAGSLAFVHVQFRFLGDCGC